MVQAQGLPTLDSYRTLQLDPRAPRELVVEAYWALVRRARRHFTGHSGSASRVQALNAAYASVMSGVAPDAASPTPAADYYAILYIDPSADAEIIDMAHTVLLAQTFRQDATKHREVLDAAHRTLSHPQRRAAYDAARETAAPATDDGIARPSSPAASATPASGPGGAPPASKRRGLFPRRRREQETPGDARVRRLRDDPAFGEVIDDARRAPARNGNGVAPDATFERPTTAGGELIFIAGPRAGECAVIADSVPVQGQPGRDGRTRELARVWHRDGRFFLNQTSRGDVRVGGRRMAMELVVLDDGDEIEIGPHHARFRLVFPE